MAQRTMPPGWRAGGGPRLLPHTCPSPLLLLIIAVRLYRAKARRQSAHTVHAPFRAFRVFYPPLPCCILPLGLRHNNDSARLPLHSALFSLAFHLPIVFPMIHLRAHARLQGIQIELGHGVHIPQSLAWLIRIAWPIKGPSADQVSQQFARLSCTSRRARRCRADLSSGLRGRGIPLLRYRVPCQRKYNRQSRVRRRPR